MSAESWFGDPQYKVDGSIRFNNADNGFLQYGPLAAGNRRTWTLSLWIKRGLSTAVTGYEDIFSVSGSNSYISFSGDNDDSIRIFSHDGSVRMALVTEEVFRDPMAWYHLIFRCDTTQSTASERFRLYVNGREAGNETTAEAGGFKASANNYDLQYPDQNYELEFNKAALHDLGAAGNEPSYYMAEVNFVDGISLGPDSFGETETLDRVGFSAAQENRTGQWVPVKYSGAFGTNGYYLPFSGTDEIASATGGTITTDATNFKVHKFTSSGTYVLSAPDTGFAEVDILIVGGGGNAPGGSSSLGGGGGGAGGFYYKESTCLAAGTYSVVVGAATVSSSFAGITATRGGNGGSQGAGADGGSGGGGVGNAAAGAGQALLGNNGGIGLGTIGASVCSGGGGGGAAAVGTNSADNATGNTLSFSDGGAGLAVDIIAAGTDVTFAAGGKGGDHDSSTAGVDGAANTGNGASGGGGSGGAAGTGGSGIVVIRHKFQ